VSLYNRGDLSLRDVVDKEISGDRTPIFTTLHCWTEGLGAYCLGRSTGEVYDALPASRVLSELEARYSQMSSLRYIPLWINPARYRSEARRERLNACKRLELYCGLLDAPKAQGLSEFNRLILAWGNSCGFGFRSGICCTAVEHPSCSVVAKLPLNSKKEVLPCPIHGRSPTGDSR
jgi:hypothetical protein